MKKTVLFLICTFILSLSSLVFGYQLKDDISLFNKRLQIMDQTGSATAMILIQCNSESLLEAVTERNFDIQPIFETDISGQNSSDQSLISLSNPISGETNTEPAEFAITVLHIDEANRVDEDAIGWRFVLRTPKDPVTDVPPRTASLTKYFTSTLFSPVDHIGVRAIVGPVALTFKDGGTTLCSLCYIAPPTTMEASIYQTNSSVKVEWESGFYTQFAITKNHSDLFIWTSDVDP